MIFASQERSSRRSWLRQCSLAAVGAAGAAGVADSAPAVRPQIASFEFDLRRHVLSLWWRDDAGNAFKSFEAVQASLKPKGRRLAFAMNAGMYEPDFSPVGLFVANGREERPLNTRGGTGNFYLKPNGVFLVTQSGAAGVRDTDEMSGLKEPLQLATQSGPLLVRRGTIHPAFNAQSKSRLIRNGVGVRDPHTVVFAIAEVPVTFHEFASHFRDALGCPDALYLDGTISSVFSAASPARQTLRAELGPIIGVTAAP